MPTITLYGPVQAPFVTKVRGALALKRLEYAFREPSGPEDYRRWSPETGLLPVIEVDGVRVHDSSAILDFLDARYPDPPLVSSDAKVASSQRRLEAWVEQTFFFYWTKYLRLLVNREEGQAPAEPEAGRRRSARGGILRRGAPVRPAGQGLGAEFARRLDDLVNFLGNRPFFYADQISRADLAVYSFLRRIPEAAGPQVAAELEARAPLLEHLERVEKETGGPA